MTTEKSIRESIVEAMNPEEEIETVDVVEEEPIDEPAEEDDGVKEIKEPEAESAPIVDEFAEPPVSLKAEMKAKWKDLPSDVRAEWSRREGEIHRAMTAKDGDLNLGRTIKEIAAPYEAIIRSEGGTVEGAFKDLLNTSYILRTGSPQQKAQAIQAAIQQFGVDVRLLGQGQQQVDPNIAHLQREIQTLRQQANPETIKSQLQEQMERDNIQKQISEFAANPKNAHFETVRSQMGALITSGQAKDLQDAYEQACWANPSIRSELLKAQSAQEAEKKKAEMAKKKNAAASVMGSPDGSSPATITVKKSIRDNLKEAMAAQRESAI